MTAAYPRCALRVAIAVTVAVTIGCASGRGKTVLPLSRQTPQKRSVIENYDDLLLKVEQRVPGFGGMFIGEDGKLCVYLLDTSQLAAARLAIATVFGPQRVPSAGVRALKGQYTISQLKQWAERAQSVFEIRGVTMVDLDEAKNRVAIGVEDDSRVAPVERALMSLRIPREAVVIDVTGQIKPMGGKHGKSHRADRKL